VIEAKQPKAKQKQPQKKAAAAPRQPRQQVQQELDDEQLMQAAPAARTTTQPVQGQGGAQPMPGAQPTWPTDAQPAPRR